MISENNKRIAKNTLLLYLRTGFSMIISLFTSRITLQTLGVENYGIISVVGGVVVLFSFFNGAMSTGTQRFLNFALGRNDDKEVGRVFSMSMNVHWVISAVILILAETIGLWFLNAKLNIPEGRMFAANVVYQFSVASTVLGIMLVPYNAIITAHERFDFAAWISIVSTVLNLGIVYLLYIGNFDKLILLSILTFLLGCLMQVVNVVFCKRTFGHVAKYYFIRDKKLFRELISFSGWNLLGGLAFMANTQGLNMVLNIFCGVTVNAAMGIANQVSSKIYVFVSNFQAAFNPQIVKHFAAGDDVALRLLITRAARISFALMLLFTSPVIANTEPLLVFWLGIVPDYTIPFVRLAIFYLLAETVTAPLYTLVTATGKLKEYQLIIGCMFLLNIPVAIFVLWVGLSPAWVMASRLGITLAMLPVRIWVCRKYGRLSARSYLFDVLIRLSLFGAIVLIPTCLFAQMFTPLWGFLISGTFSTCAVGLGTWFFCFSNEERLRLWGLFAEKVLRKTL